MEQHPVVTASTLHSLWVLPTHHEYTIAFGSGFGKNIPGHRRVYMICFF